MNDGAMNGGMDAERRRGIRRTAWITVGIALAFYLGFIAMSVLRARHMV